ncbi:MAG: hypothetical protein QNJ88_08265 [Acidimicrobiia bacterium]|nr:hypothetical protein [Acidimicrobiia bacterium]
MVTSHHRSDTFRFEAQYDWQGVTYVGDIEVELDGDLLSRLEWIRWEPKQ